MLPATASATNPLAPFFGVTPMSGPGKTLADPVLVPDGPGFLAAAVRYEGVAGPNALRRVWVTRWTPSRGWSPAVAVSGRLGPVEAMTAVSDGSRAAIAWVHLVTLVPGSPVRELQVAERPSTSAQWGGAATIDAFDPMGPTLVLTGGSTLLAYRDYLYDPGSGGPRDAVGTAVHLAPGGPWSASRVLATNAYVAGAAAIPGGGAVVAWNPVAAGGVTAATWSAAGGWQPAEAIGDPAAAACSGGVDGSATRTLAVMTCAGGGRTWLASRELSSAGWSAPVVAVAPTVDRPVVEQVLAGNPGVAVQYSRYPEGDSGVRQIWVVRSDASGAWSAPALAVTSPWANPAVGLAGGTVVTVWIDRSGRTSRIRARTWPAGAGMSDPVWLSPPGKTVFFPSVAGSPAGAVVGWQAYGPRPWQAQAATWTPGGGWSVARQLSVNGVQAFGPGLAVAGTSMAAGWYGPTGIRLATGSLADPRPRGPARVVVTGRVLRCLAPAFVPRPAALSYRWLRGTTPIAGATRSTFVVPTSLVRTSLRCRVTALTTGFRPAVAYSSLVRVLR